MRQQHPRAGKAHHFANLPPHLGLVTVYRALCARGLVLLKRTFIDPLHGIAQKTPALSAQTIGLPVPRAAIQLDHRLDSASLSIQAVLSDGHSCIIFEKRAREEYGTLSFQTQRKTWPIGDPSLSLR
jgi:hypothetical protein